MASPLGLMGLQPSTVADYTKQVSRFLIWCSAHAYTPHLSSAHLDDALTAYVHFLFESGGRTSAFRTYANQVLAGVLTFAPHLTSHLHRSSQALAGWARFAPSEPRAALSWPVVVLVASTMTLQGRLQHAVATLLGVDLYLRPN